MNKEIKQKWIEALRSGRYKQGRGQLRKDDTFCCLGVLCDISEEGKWKKYESDYVYESCINYLPIPIKQKAQLESYNESALSVMNDEGKSFEEIAKYIEENY